MDLTAWQERFAVDFTVPTNRTTAGTAPLLKKAKSIAPSYDKRAFYYQANLDCLRDWAQHWVFSRRGERVSPCDALAAQRLP